MAHEPVEIERGRDPCIDLVVLDLRFVAHGFSHLQSSLGRSLQGAAFRHVQDDLKFALVVEGQHFHLHESDTHQRHRSEQEPDYRREECPAPAGVGKERPHDAAVKPREKILLVLEVGMRGGISLRRGVCVAFRPFQNPDRGPRGYDKCDGQRKKHGGARSDRDRAHVWPHEPAHKGHGQDGGNHRKRGQDGGVADFVDRLDGNLRPAPALVVRQVEMANDIFHHDDGIIDEDADREDQREQRDPVERVAVEVENQQCQRERAGNRDPDDDRLPPAEREQDQHRNTDDSDQHVKEKLVRFFRCRLRVVTGDGRRHIQRDESAFQRVHFF